MSTTDPTGRTLDANLELDSLDLVDMVVLIDKNFGFTVTAKDFAGIKTFQDFYNLVISHMQKED